MTMAVVAVWDNRGRGYRTCRSCWAAMEDYTALLSDRTAVRARDVPMSGGRPYPVAARIDELPGRMIAVFLSGLGAAESAAVQSINAANAGRLVVSETDSLTAAVAAAAVTALRGKGIPPRRGRLAVLGAERAPRLEAVLLECGAGSVTSRHGSEFDGPTVRRLTVEHDVVVNLTGRDSMWLIPTRTVSVPAHPFDFAALALPGLLAALCGHGAAHVDVDALAAAACAIALITPVGRILPELHDPRLGRVSQ